MIDMPFQVAIKNEQGNDMQRVAILATCNVQLQLGQNPGYGIISC
jgi:hypothetical protein